MTTQNAPAPEAPQNFETALQRLEQIAAQMESGRLELDAMLAAFEEGQRLVRYCTAKLDEVERKIEALVKTPSGDFTPQTTPYP
jgi:exodeoxyribonuclease VII small subunit